MQRDDRFAAALLVVLRIEVAYDQIAGGKFPGGRRRDRKAVWILRAVLRIDGGTDYDLAGQPL
jgi:hypothetical protein